VAARRPNEEAQPWCVSIVPWGVIQGALPRSGAELAAVARSSPATRRGDRGGHFRRWVENHDDRWSFTLSYLGLALILSTTISLFWLVALVAAHMALEWIALVRRGERQHRLAKVVWHVKLDLALVLFALALGLYFDVLFGLLGLGAAARTGSQLTARFVAWQRGLRTVLLSADDVALVAKAAARRAGGEAEPAYPAKPKPEEVDRPQQGQWSRGDVATVTLGLLFALLIAVAPVLTDHDLIAVIRVLGSELHPWPR
jgi:hypothetical protein